MSVRPRRREGRDDSERKKPEKPDLVNPEPHTCVSPQSATNIAHRPVPLKHMHHCTTRTEELCERSSQTVGETRTGDVRHQAQNTISKPKLVATRKRAAQRTQTQRGQQGTSTLPSG